MRPLYSLAWLLALPLVCLRLWWRGRKEPGYRQHWPERFGWYRSQVAGHGRLIWLHAVSVGETRAAQPLVAALLRQYPDAAILLTHMTPTGRATGQALFAEHGPRLIQSYLPYDMVWLVMRFLRHFAPVCCILMETEVWPNLLYACEKARVPVLLANARLSERSMRRGQKMGALMRGAAQRITLVAAQTEADAARIRALGAPRVLVTGSIKFDVTPPESALALGRALRSHIGARPVLLCASTREGEEALLLAQLAPDLVRDLATDFAPDLAPDSGPDLEEASVAAPAQPPLPPLPPLLLLVPRHPQRFDEVAALCRQHGLQLQRRSALPATLPPDGLPQTVQVLLGDSMGEMFAYYAACDLAFIGGSLLPLGGQNLIEACAVGKPVLIGPHTFNFLEVTELALAAGAAQRVPHAQGLQAAAHALLADASQMAHMGQEASRFAAQHRGATDRTMAVLREWLG
jgi:3-deoxy-D-manno-octulosonic-acid transferase